MRSTWRFVASTCCAVAMTATAAHAVELMPSATEDLKPIKWTGFIVAPYFGYETLKLNGSGSNYLDDASGWRVGGELDYDYQIGNFVVGVAGDAFFTWYDGKGVSGYSQLSSHLNDYGTFRGRLGYAVGRWMFFATGGYALGDLQVKNTQAGNVKNTLGGWTAGGGAEWVWNNNFTLRGEVAHMVLNPQTFSNLPAGSQELGATLDLFKVDFITRF
jgi:outer membrane immunogenic protein